MSKEELRPIGTEFWYEFPVKPFENIQNRFLYKVKSHDLCLRFLGDKRGELLECIEAIKKQTRRVLSATLVRCPVCKQNRYEYEFDEWKEES